MAWQSTQAATLFNRIRTGDFHVVASTLVEVELLDAPPEVRGLFTGLTSMGEWRSITREALELRDAYIASGVVTANHSVDALHVALATVARCDALLSWDNHQFSNKAGGYNRMNLQKGYGTIPIYAPNLFLQLHP
jgi:predicted nucleic acid-binding protein